MSTEAHIYANDGAAGPVNTATPIGTATGLSFATPALSLGSDNTFQVRNFDSVSGLEEQNTDARVRILIGPTGIDITGQPNAPTGLTASLAKAGVVKLAWQYNPGGQGGAPQGFHVYAGTPAISYAAPVATVAYAKGVMVFSCSLATLTPGSAYQIGVRAYNATNEETNVNVVTVTPDNTGPAAVDSLTATVVA